MNGTAALLGWLVAIAVVLAQKIALAQATLAWSAPAQARVITWPSAGSPEEQQADTAGTTGAKSVDPEHGARLAPEQVLLVPVDPGDRIELCGPVAAAGLASGVHEIPDVITWMDLPAAHAKAKDGVETREIGIPMWTSARFVAVRGRVDRTVAALEASKRAISVRVAVREHVPMQWFRADENVARWLIGGGDGPPAAPAPEAQALVRWLVAARASLSSVPEALADDWLMAKWLEESLRIRPLVEPFFVKRSASIEGGKDSGELPPVADSSQWRVLGAGREGKATITASASDVLRIVLRARGVGSAVAVVREGDFIARVLSWDVASRMADASRWTAPLSIRAVLPVASTPVTIEVVEGEVAFAVTAYRRRIDALDWIPARLDRYTRLASIEQAQSTGAASEVMKGLSVVLREHTAQAADKARTRVTRPDVAAPLRALVLAEAVGWAASSEQAGAAAEQGFQASAKASRAAIIPLRRRMLEQLAAVHPDPLAQPAAWIAWPASPGHEDDLAVLAAYRAALAPEEDGARPLGAPAAERYAWAHGELRDAAARARQVWVREAPWKALKIPEGTRVFGTAAAPVDSAQSGRMCRVVGPGGLRWTVLPEGKTTLVTSVPPQATHARIVVRGETMEPAVEQTLRVDGVPISVHTGAGLDSLFALAPGSRLFERGAEDSATLAGSADPPARAAAPVLLARIPREGDAPCDTLREIVSWARLQGSARFTVPGAGRPTVVRIVFHPSSAQSPGLRRIRVLVGDRWIKSSVRADATGSVELPVPAGVEVLQVEVEEEMLVRVSARLHGRKPEPPRWLITPAPAKESIDVLLARVRNATRRLRSAPPPLQPAIRLERGKMLESLGVRHLASFDLLAGEAASVLGEPGTSRAPEPAEQVEPEPDEALPRPNRALVLPPDSPPVVPLGFAARVPALPLPSNADALSRARARMAAGDLAGATAELASSSARESSGADALLFAHLTERAGALWLAIEALTRIGLTHRSGIALARAATLAADLAVEESSQSRALWSFILAELARESGDPASSAFARLSQAIAWVHVIRADATAGTGLVEKVGTPVEQTLGTKARRALVDAPDEALLLTEGQRLEIRMRQRQASMLSLDSLCHALGPGPDCAFEVRLDGKPARCKSRPGAVSKCAVPIPSGSHRIVLGVRDDREAIGWVIARDGSSGLPVPARVVSEWFEIDPARPLELGFAAPTVLRVEARVVARSAQELKWSITPSLVTTNVPSDGTLVPDPGFDPAARRVGGKPSEMTPLGGELEQRIAVPDSGPHTLHIDSPGGRALVRVQIAVAAGLPRPRTAIDMPVSSGRVPDAGMELPLRRAPPVLDDPDPGPGTAGVLVRFSDDVLGDEDEPVQTTQIEADVHVRRELIVNRLWARSRVFTRFRDGPASAGVGADFDATSSGFIPGGFANAVAVVQPFPFETVFGARASLGVLWSLSLARRLTLVPWASFTVRAVDERNKNTNEVDRDIFTRYASTHPNYGTLGLRMLLRPAIDAIARLNLSARTSPYLGGMDRYDFALDTELLLNRGFFPRIGVRTGISVRPVTEQRSVAFFRTSASMDLEFWRWVTAGHRVAVGSALTGFLDVPNVTEAGRLSLGLFIGYDYTGRRGLRDWPPGERPFRARLEEDSGRIERQGAGADAVWVESEE